MRVKEVIQNNFPGWEDDSKELGIGSAKATIIKYQGKVKNIGCEIQIVPMLHHSFLNVEHDTLYKSDITLKNATSHPRLVEIKGKILAALDEYEQTFARVLRQSERAQKELGES